MLKLYKGSIYLIFLSEAYGIDVETNSNLHLTAPFKASNYPNRYAEDLKKIIREKAVLLKAWCFKNMVIFARDSSLD